MCAASETLPRWSSYRLYARVGTSAPIVERHGLTRHGPMTYQERPPRL